MNRTLQSLLAILGVLVVGFLAWRWVVAAEAAPPKAPPRDLGPVPVAVLRVEAREVELLAEAFGNLEARRRAQLTAEVGGRIVEVHPDWRPGAAVEEGEVLVRLERELFELNVAEGRALLAEAEAGVEAAAVAEGRAVRALDKALERLTVTRREYERLVELGSVASESLRDASLRTRIEAEAARDDGEAARDSSRASLAMARARVEIARVRLARAKEELARTEIRAPFAGRLRGQAPGLGTLAVPGVGLGELLDTSQLVLTAHVPERDLLFVRVGQDARLSFPATPETFAGPPQAARVTAVDAASDGRTRRGVVELELVEAGGLSGADGGIENPGGAGRLPVGLFARATISIDRLQDALWIDRRHFAWEDGEAVAYVLEPSRSAARTEGVARRRVLVFGREHGEGFVVVSGLLAGDTLILRPLDRLADGTPVRVLERATPEAGAARPSPDGR